MRPRHRSLPPETGDLSLCIKCGCLNAYGEDLKLTKPTDEQYLWAAQDRKIQFMRRAIEEVNNKAKKRPE